MAHFATRQRFAFCMVGQTSFSFRLARNVHYQQNGLKLVQQHSILSKNCQNWEGETRESYCSECNILKTTPLLHGSTLRLVQRYRIFGISHASRNKRTPPPIINAPPPRPLKYLPAPPKINAQGRLLKTAKCTIHLCLYWVKRHPDPLLTRSERTALVIAFSRSFWKLLTAVLSILTWLFLLELSCRFCGWIFKNEENILEFRWS